MNDSGCFTAKNITGSPNADTFYLAYSTLAGDRISFEKTFLLIIHARLKICNIYIFENEAILVMFNLASKYFGGQKNDFRRYPVTLIGTQRQDYQI